MEFDRPGVPRAVSLAVVLVLHVLVIALLVSQSATVERVLPLVFVGVPIARPAPPPPQPPVLTPKLAMPDLAPIPAPEIAVVQPAAPRAVRRVAPAVSHFGPATNDMGLGVEAATSAGGGARGRGSLGEFQAAVRRAVLARKVQPSLAWDRRNTCVINYVVSVGRDGSLAGLRIDACAVPEINAAAEAAIRAAAPFPAPPDLGGAHTDVHGTLIFHP
jgi:protein TonB